MRTVIVGAGTVGLATGRGLQKLGHTTVFVDTNLDVLDTLKDEVVNTPEKYTLQDVDAVFIAVDAPTTETGFDATNLLAATLTVGQKLSEINEDDTPTIVFRTTQPPGTTRNTLIPLLHQTSGKQVNKDFGVMYWPEYLRAHSAEKDFTNPRIIVISTPKKNDLAHSHAGRITIGMDAPIHWLPLEAAELQKYFSNAFNATKISVYNWFRELAEKIGVTPEEINNIFAASCESSEGMWNPQYGTRNSGPYAGACLPKDVAALRIFAETAGLNTDLLKAVEKVNKDIAAEGP